MVDFTNTEIAFRIKSNRELLKAKLLFGTIKYPFIVKCLSGLSSLALKLRFPVSWIVKPTLYAQFVGGETLEDCDKVAKQLFSCRVYSILDYSVEGKESEGSIEQCFQEILRGIKLGSARNYVTFAVFKPTGITHAEVLEKVSSKKSLTDLEKEEFKKFTSRVEELCAAAVENGISILVDAEDYCYQDAVDEVVELMMGKFNKEKAVVYNTLQMYRIDRLQYLKDLHVRAKAKNFKVGAKFVRGAYMEKERKRALLLGYPSPINEDKDATDQNYDDALIYSVANLNDISIFAGTHNEDSVRLLVELIYKYALAPNDSRIWFSQLYGMSDNLTFNLAEEGVNITKYVPYGPVKEVLPYLVRRATENTSVAGQTTRELNLINEEIKRRKSYKQW